MEEPFIRTRALLGTEGMRRLREASVAVFGVGGVGSFCAEALARAGVGGLLLVDGDVVAESNLNRQLVALRSTLGRAKAEVMAERIRDINPFCDVRAKTLFYLPENAEEVDFSGFSYVVDAVDTVAAKLLIVVRAKAAGVPVISSMGAGNKLDPAAFEVADIYETSVCPLARVMRSELKKRGVKALKVVYSKEKPVLPDFPEGMPRVPGSTSFTPSSAGLLIASEVVKDIAQNRP